MKVKDLNDIPQKLESKESSSGYTSIRQSKPQRKQNPTDRQGHYIMIKKAIRQEDIAI